MPSPAKRWQAYFAERFPIAVNLIVASLFTATCGLAALTANGHPLTGAAAGRLAVAAIVVLFVFLHIRIFDEHKDYALDVVAHPDRVVSKGWVTLAQLRRVGMVVIPAEIILSACISPAFLLATLAVIGYSLLMLKEFFVAEWLKRHMLLYGISHMAILILQAVSVFACLQGLIPAPYDPISRDLLVFTGMIVSFGYSIEIARKIRPPEKEKPDVDTYSKLFGIRGAIVAVMVCEACGLMFLRASGVPVSVTAWRWILGAIGLAWLVLLATWVKPQPKTLDKLDGVGAIPFMVLQLALIITWAAQ